MPQEKRNITQELKELLAKIIDVEPQELRPEAHFYRDLGVDSVKAIEIAVAIERHFKVSIRDEQVSKIATLQQAADAVKEALGKNNG